MPDCECSGWYAVHDHQGPPTLRVQGTCRVPEGGTQVSLRPLEPQGANDKDLLLELVFTAPPIGRPVIEDAPVLFEWVTATEYDTVSIVDCELGIAVHDVH